MTLKTRLILLVALSIFDCANALAQNNVALKTRTNASGTTTHKPPAFLTDGDFSTYSQPSYQDAKGFHFEMDLEESYNLHKIIVHNRFAYDYRIDIYADNFGIRGDLLWSSDITEHSPNNRDTIAINLFPQGKFPARFIRLTNTSSVAHAPSIYEIEVQEALLPVVDYFETDAGNITAAGNAELPTSANISWQASRFDTLWINQEIGGLGKETGELNLSPKSTTTYTLTATNSYGSITKSLTIAVDNDVLHPKITEFLASNAATIEDEDGDKSDWIELYNPNDFSLNIKDYYLTDDAADLTKWKIPARTIGPREFLILFASSKDRKDTSTPLHTNFKLSSDGDYLALVANDGQTVLQQFPANYPSEEKYPELDTDVSYGTDASGNTGFFEKPSPGIANNSPKQGIVKKVKLSPERGIYNAPVNVELSCKTSDAVIRYTTDGSEPTQSNGTIYSNPVELTSTKILRTKAFKDDYISSSTKTHSYIFIDKVISSSVMDKDITSVAAYKNQIKKGLVELPSISLLMEEPANNTTEVKTSLEWIDPIKEEDLQVNAGIKYFGGSFTNFDKENYRLYFRKVHGDSKLKHPLFEGYEYSVPAVDKFDRLDLRAGSHDMNMRGFYMSNRFADDIMLKSGHLNPHGRYVHLYLNGVYWGQYHLRERWDDDMFSEYFDRDKEEFEAVSGNINLGGWSRNEIFYAGDGSTWQLVKSLREDYMSVKDYVDIPQLIDFMLLYMYGNCESEFKAVGTKEPGVGFKFYFNDADGFTRKGSDRTQMDQPGQNHADGPGSIFSMLVKEGHPDFNTLLGDRIQTLLFNDGILTPDSITQLMEERCEEVENSIVAECARWGYHTPSSWSSKKNSYVKTVLPLRANQLITNLKSAGLYPYVDAPAFSQHGGFVPSGYQLEILSNEPEVYYTTDGSDPRLPGGNISGSAIAYTATGTQYIKLLGENVNVSALVPTSESLGTNWTKTDFSETNDWQRSTKGAGVGYDNDATYRSHINLDVADRMQGKNTSVYLRYEFDLSDLEGMNDVILKMKYDDGFVAYLNGTAIAAVNAPTSLAWNSKATSQHNDSEAVNFVQISLSNNDAQSLLSAGKNVLAIHGLNVNVTSTDFLIEPELYVTRQNDATNLEYISINEAINIKARAYDGAGNWSPIIDATFTIDENAVGVHEMFANEVTELKAYPNPCKDYTTLRFNVHSGSEVMLEVYNMLGKKVWMENISTQPGITYSKMLDTSHWRNGIFIYRLTTDSGIVESGKLVRSE